MDWSNERYVRLYTRDTMTWLRLHWQGQALLALLIRKVDRAGILDNVDDPVGDISLITGFPEEHTKVGLERLIKHGVVHINTNNTLVMPNYTDAQESSKTDKQRQKESREKRKASAQLVTKRDSDVTKRDKNVTTGHSVSQPVTPCCAVPCSTVPMLPEISPPAPPVEKAKKPRKPTGQGTPTWIAYSEAYQERYGVGIERSQKISSQCLDLFKRLGEEDSPRVATFYFQSSNQYYQTRYHPLDLLVKDCETIKAEMIALNKKRAPYKPLVSKRPVDIF